MSKILNIAFLVSAMILFSCSTDSAESRIREAVDLELHYYPEATLLDIYKNFFQDAFGPGHIISDSSSALNYLQKELDEAKQFNAVQWQPLGYYHNYYRVNLSLVKNKKLPFDLLFYAFLESANSASPPSIEEWKKEWNYIIQVIESMDLEIKNYEEDKQYLEELLAQGKYVIHHSKIYGELYFPHYRIISRAFFYNLNIPRISDQ